MTVYRNMNILIKNNLFQSVELKGEVKSDIHHQSVKTQDVNEEKIPPCHTACTESLLGIRNMQRENIADLLLKVSVYLPNVKTSNVFFKVLIV